MMFEPGRQPLSHAQAEVAAVPAYMDYKAYDLVIRSDIRLPLPVAHGQESADIFVRAEPIGAPEAPLRTIDGVWYAFNSNSLWLRWDILGAYLMISGREIVVDPIAGIAPDAPAITVPLLGTVMAVTLHQRGTTTLHGSSVTLSDDRAIIFLGAKSEGKSTFADFCCRQGHGLLTDDVCAVTTTDTASVIAPSFPNLKLWPDAMHYLDYTPEDHHKVHPNYEKRSINVSRRFHATSCRVAAIVALASGETINIDHYTGHRAIPLLMPHLIVNRFAERQPDTLQKNIYGQLTGLIKSVPILQLTRPRDLHLLPDVYDLLKRTIENSS